MAFWQVFTAIFLLGLGGAMSPGALLTYEIYMSIKAKKKAYKIGIWVSFGHTIVEFIIILFLLFGLAPFLSNSTVIFVIGFIGGILLILFGSQILRDIIKKNVGTSFLDKLSSEKNLNNNNSLKNSLENSLEKKKTPKNGKTKSKLYSLHPVIGTMLFLISNPFFWLWWSTIGLTIMIKYSVSFSNIPSLLGFVIGKELGAVLWYGGVLGVSLSFSSKIMTKKLYLGILTLCSIFMVGYGLYLIISLFFM